MQLTRKSPTCPGWLRKCTFLIPAIVCTYIFSFAAFIPQVSAATPGYPGGNVANPVVRQVDIDRPAVVRIITTLNGRLTVHFDPTTDVETFPLGGGNYPLQLSGSGTFISSHGDLLTADHVVNPPHDQSMDEFLYSLAASDVANYVNAHFQVSQPFTENDVIASLENGTFTSTTSYSAPSSSVYLSTAYTGPIKADNFDDVPSSNYATVDKIEAQSAVDQDDVAIVHVTGMDDMSSIQLGDSSRVAEQDNLTIIGYPGNGDISIVPTNLLTSSINKVYVSAIKTTDEDAPLIQIGGNVEHGDSGGPALDENGNIVGIVSVGLANADDIGETTFLQASNSAETLIRSLNISTAPGPFERAWTQAFDDYASSTPGHWHKAAQELQSLSRNYAGFLGITSFLTYAQGQASHETAPTSSTIALNPVLLIGLLLILLVIVGFLFLVIQKRRHQVALANHGFTPPMYGAYQPAQGASGVYPPQPASYGPTGYPSPQGTSGVYPPQPASYGATSWYEQPTGQIVQTPLPVNPSFTPLPPVQSTPLAENLAEDMPQETVRILPEPAKQIESTDQPVPLGQNGLPTTNGNLNGSSETTSVQTDESSTPTFISPAQVGGEQVLQDPSFIEFSATGEQAAVKPLPPNPGWVPVTSFTGEEKIAPAPLAQNWNFSVPRRPAVVSLPGSEQVAEEEASGEPWIAPCGHANAPDASFCRVCGQPIQLAQTDITPGSRE